MERDNALGQLDALIGRDVRGLADEHNVTVWKDGKLNKGWVGHTIERFLGLPLNSSRSPNLGSWELKVASLKYLRDHETLRVKETMWLTMIDEEHVMQNDFEKSHLLVKLAKLVVVARIFQSQAELQTIIHSISTFSLDEPKIYNQVQEDYEEVRNAIRMKGFNSLTGKMGVLVQPRTKGTGHGSTSRAFYARKGFVGMILGL